MFSLLNVNHLLFTGTMEQRLSAHQLGSERGQGQVKLADNGTQVGKAEAKQNVKASVGGPGVGEVKVGSKR